MMDFLLDTCTFLWLVHDPSSLSKPAVRKIKNAQNKLFLSSISLWEIEQKASKVKVYSLKDDVGLFCIKQRKLHDIKALDFNEGAAALLGQLPNLHRDPFDRMLICQALYHDLTMITPDRWIHQYDIPTLW